MSNQTMVWPCWLGKTATVVDFDVTMLFMLDQLSGQVPTYQWAYSMAQSKSETPVKSSYFGIVDTAGIQEWLLPVPKPMGFLLRRRPMVFTFFLTGIGEDAT